MKQVAQELVLLGMFDASRPDRARAVRIYNLHRALLAQAPTRLIDGDRPTRRKALLRYLAGGGLGKTRAIYVEASTSTATELDLSFLAMAHAVGIPILIFIPDAYQYFPALYPRVGVKTALLDWGWRRSIATYLRVADRLLFPSRGLANYFPTPKPVTILPPGGPAGLEPATLNWDTPTVVYVGGANYRYGSDLLLDAMQQVVARCPTARCHFISGDATYLDQHPARHASWLTVERRAFHELPTVMRTATVAVVPLRINEYNDLAVPVKLFDYMAFGLPLVVTACRDTAALVQEMQSGLVVADQTAALADGILRLLEDSVLAQQLGNNGYQAIQNAHSWSHRAAALLQMVTQLEAGSGK